MDKGFLDVIRPDFYFFSRLAPSSCQEASKLLHLSSQWQLTSFSRVSTTIQSGLNQSRLGLWRAAAAAAAAARKKEAVFCFASITSGWLLVYCPLECFLTSASVSCLLVGLSAAIRHHRGRRQEQYFWNFKKQRRGDSCNKMKGKA